VIHQSYPKDGIVMAMEKNFDAGSAETRLYDAWEKAGCFKAGANAKPEASSTTRCKTF